ncbi:hypothetical protein BJ165DRAFT_1572182 [Panaeolus papilionaceus]|nr:hypothetical protein BJ165DRAFT_1572182 [Panaeolus papilionaceus]
MADSATRSTQTTIPSEKATNSLNVRQKWTSQIGAVVRTASQRLSIHKKHPHEESVVKDEKTPGEQALKRTSSWMSSISASKQSLVSRHLKRDSTRVVITTPQPKSSPSATSSLHESMVIIPLTPAAEEIVAPTSSLETNARPLLSPSLIAESKEGSTDKSDPVLVQVNLDGSIVELVISPEEEDDAAAPALPLNAASANTAAAERAEDVEVTDSPVIVATPEPATTNDIARAEAEQRISDEDQNILDSMLLPHEDETFAIHIISRPEPLSQSAYNPRPLDVAPMLRSPLNDNTPTTTETLVGVSNDPSMRKIIITAAVVSVVAVAGVGAILVYTGVISGISLGGIAGGLGGSARIFGWKGRRIPTGQSG